MIGQRPPLPVRADLPAGFKMRRFLSLHLPAILLFFLLSLQVTWPLWVDPNRRLMPGDPELNSYLLNHVQRALLHDIGNFYQTTKYWPLPDTLTYGEMLLTPALLALPARWLGAGPVGVHNFSLLSGFFLSALAAYALGWHFFRERAAATAVGLAYGFAAYRIGQSGHLQLVHGAFLPLMVLGFEWSQRGGRRRQGCLLLGVSALAQWLSSWYWAVFSFWFMAPYMVGRWLLERRRLDRGRLLGPLAALALAGGVVLALAWPYFEQRRLNTFIRPAELVATFAAQPADFIRPPVRNLVWGWAARGDDGVGVALERSLFPGLLASLALIVALGHGLRRAGRRPRRGFPLGLWLAITLLLMSFCFGSALAHYRLASLLPGSDQMRVPARWMLPALLGLAVLMGWVYRRWFGAGRTLTWRRAGWAALGLLVVESLARPIGWQEVFGRPGAFEQWLEAQTYPSPTLILPPDLQLLTLSMAHHTQPLVNGANGYFPYYHMSRMEQLTRFPDVDVTRALRLMRVRFVAIQLAAGRGTEADQELRLGQAIRNRPEDFAGIIRLGRWMIVELAPPPPELPLMIPKLGGVPGIGTEVLREIDPATAAAVEVFLSGG